MPAGPSSAGHQGLRCTTLTRGRAGGTGPTRCQRDAEALPGEAWPCPAGHAALRARGDRRPPRHCKRPRAPPPPPQRPEGHLRPPNARGTCGGKGAARPPAPRGGACSSLIFCFSFLNMVAGGGRG